MKHYISRLLHDINEDDHDRREEMLYKISSDFTESWSEDATFRLDGSVNRYTILILQWPELLAVQVSVTAELFLAFTYLQNSRNIYF